MAPVFFFFFGFHSNAMIALGGNIPSLLLGTLHSIASRWLSLTLPLPRSSLIC